MDYIFINKLGKEPYYLQIVNSVKAAIQSGRLQHNDPLPHVNSLCARYNISNIVVIQAYQTLADEHLIVSIRGKGSFVNTIPQFEMDASNVHGIFNQFKDHKIAFQIVLLDHVALSARELHFFGMTQAQKAYKLVWTGSIQQTPFIQTTLLLPESVFPDLKIEEIQPMHFVEYFKQRLGVKQLEAISHFRIRTAEAEVAFSMAIDKSDACTLMTTQYQHAGMTIALTESYIPGKFMKIRFSVGGNA